MIAATASVENIIRDTAEVLRPPRRLSVAEAAEKYIYLNVPGGYSGPWKNDLVHYMVEPAECLTSRGYEAVVFVGPARSGKTQVLCDNWIAHTLICDPADMMVVQPSQDRARDYSKSRVDRMIDGNAEIKKRLRANRQANNTHDKYFKAGNILYLAWPTKNQLSGKDICKIVGTDYDRFPDDVDGEGNPFALMMKRTTTFLSKGMTMIESSPSRDVQDSKWKPKTPHEAPPTNGILGVYNTGDRRMLYCQCPHCEKYFAPPCDISAWHIPAGEDHESCAEQAALICQKCGALITQEFEQHIKKSAKWVKEGQAIDSTGRITGTGRRSNRATFWMSGVFAAFQSWRSICLNYLRAQDVYDRTGDELSLKNVYNLDVGAPYLPRALMRGRDPAVLEARAESIQKRTVPEGVRFLTAAVDIQSNRFVVQVQGWGPGLECWLIDRFNLRKSNRNYEDGHLAIVDPAGYIEDWDLIEKHVLSRTYPLESDERIEFPIVMTACDSGGKAGVTEIAYKYYRKLKKKGLSRRFMLVKGGSAKNAPRVKLTHPDDTHRKNRNAGARGDIPVHMLNTNLLKDAVSADLQREEPGERYIHFPDWLGGWFYEELSAEIRTDKGWVKETRHSNNEAFDLMVYNKSAVIVLKAETINWDRPPSWARIPELEEDSEEHRPKPAARRARFKFQV